MQLLNHWGDVLPTGVDLPRTSCPNRRDYGHIGYDSLLNTRDLGGMKGSCGRLVKKGKLLRSGTLALGTKKDIDLLYSKYDLRAIIDFRNAKERSQLPDPIELMPNASLIEAEILSKRLAGITQERNEPDFAKRLQNQHLDIDDFMTDLYPQMLTGETGIKGYGLFLSTLFANLNHTVLWHCHLGRDRCGMGAILVETMLGVDREEIIDDYLATNLFAPASYAEKYPASLKYYYAVERAVEPYGGFMGYITNVLGITNEQISTFREAHLEP